MSNIKDIRPKEIVTGITGYYAHGEKQTLGYVVLNKGAVVPEHRHVQEQITYIIEGQLDMVVGGNACTLTHGMYYIIRSNVPHSAIAITDSIVIDTFSPVREDYK